VLAWNHLLHDGHYDGHYLILLLTIGIPMQECAASFLSGFDATNAPWLRQFEANVTTRGSAMTT